MQFLSAVCRFLPPLRALKGAAAPARRVINLPLYYRSDLSLSSTLPLPRPPPSGGGSSLSRCHAWRDLWLCFISPGRALIISRTLDSRNPLPSSAAAASRALAGCAALDVRKGHGEKKKGSRKGRSGEGARRHLTPAVLLIYRLRVKCTPWPPPQPPRPPCNWPC